MKYIDAEKLKTEIERRRLSNRYIDTEGYENELLEIINSLQQEQPGVDLEEDITPSLVENMLCEFGVQSIDDMDSKNLAEFARHFYELGFNARKEE